MMPNSLEWVEIPGWEGLYDLSTSGKVWSRRTNKILTPMLQGGKRKQYEVVALCKGKYEERWKVHILMLSVFVGPRPEGMLALHRDDDQFNNDKSNLYWGTPAQNCADTRAHGRGDNQKLSVAQAVAIRRRRGAGESGASLAREFGVSQQAVCDIHKQRKFRGL